jgi:Phosphopantetheine attachment site.
MEKEFIAFVAGVFEVDISEISLHTEYKVFEKWDSLKMLTLVMELEAAYDVVIPIETLGRIKTLKDLYKLVL